MLRDCRQKSTVQTAEDEEEILQLMVGCHRKVKEDEDHKAGFGLAM